jgi:hypothetical protein
VKHFKIDEFKCPCCGKAEMSEKHLEMIDKARDLADVPFVITSGYRCPEHNAEVGGKANSEHVTGEGSDIKAVGSRERFKIIDGLIAAGFTRIGIGADFIHAGSDETKSPDVCWTYYK